MPIEITIAIATEATLYGQPIQTEPNQIRCPLVLTIVISAKATLH
jgi:hypothetical protein